MTGSESDTSNTEQFGTDVPLEATLIPAGMEAPRVRTGSPFRASDSSNLSGDATALPPDQRPIVLGFAGPLIGGEAEFEAGVASATARGGMIASLVMLPFAIVSAWLFPFGGLMIGVLGALLGAFGLSSKRLAWAIAAMLSNAALAALCFWKLV